MYKKWLIALVLLFLPIFAFAGTEQGYTLGPVACNDAIGEPVVDITHDVTNDIMLGTTGSVWANQQFTRHLKFWETTQPNEYCGINELAGDFNGIAGALSPGGKYILDGNEVGKFNLSQQLHVTSDGFNLNKWGASGYIGTFDYGCTAGMSSCPGYIDWIAQYFNGYTVINDWMSWRYIARDGGIWTRVNKAFGGDIK